MTKKGKRVPEPPVTDEEPKFLAVKDPYPWAVNGDLLEDVQNMARWIACIMGGYEHLLAIHYKPSAPKLLLVEVAVSYGALDPGFRRLLGSHKWSDFLLNPTEEDLERASKIYFAQPVTSREVSKTGWKMIEVKDAWFAKWRLANPIVKHPYPPSSWCDVPHDDKTNMLLCRPLPERLFPGHALPAPPELAPGSSKWVESRGAPAPPPAKRQPISRTGSDGSATPPRRPPGIPAQRVTTTLDATTSVLSAPPVLTKKRSNQSAHAWLLASSTPPLTPDVPTPFNWADDVENEELATPALEDDDVELTIDGLSLSVAQYDLVPLEQESAAEDWSELVVPTKEERKITCRFHGPICDGGICVVNKTAARAAAAAASRRAQTERGRAGVLAESLPRNWRDGPKGRGA